MTASDLARAIKRHWLLGLVLFVLVVGSVAGYTFTATPQYSAQTQLMAKSLAGSDSGSAMANQAAVSSGSSSVISSYAQMVQSDAVLQPVIDNLGLHVTVTQLRQLVSASASSPFMTVSVTYTDPNDTVAILDQIVNQLNVQGKDALLQGAQFSVVQKAVLPTEPSSPNIKVNMVIAVLAGLVIAVLAAAGRELSDNSIHTQSDIQGAVHAPILSSIPKSPTIAGRTPAVIVKPRGHAAEEFRRLATNLTFVVPKDSKHPNLLVVTSSGPGEGKTTVSTNLAAAYAERGESVLLIDADARHPSVAKALGISNGVGLVQLLTHQVDAKTAVQKYWKPELQVLPVEDKSTSSAVILGSESMRSMVDQATRHYDHVIIDTAPIQVSNDASVFAREGGTLLLVVSQGVGQKRALRETAHELELASVEISGVAFNRVAHEHSRKGNYYYYEEKETAKGKASHSSEGRAVRRTANSAARH